MYGLNLGVRPDAPGEPIFTKFCTGVRVADVFLSFDFQKDRVKMWELWGDVGRNFASPIEKAQQQLVATAQAVISIWWPATHPVIIDTY